MALGDDYATLAQLKNHLGITDSADDSKLTDALGATSRGIELVCGRVFNDAGVTSAREYPPATSQTLRTDDFHTTSVLIVADPDGDGVYDTVWAASDYRAEPLNGVVDGQPGWPFWRLRATGRNGRFFYDNRGRYGQCQGPVQVTARWGWAAVPKPIYQATLVVASEMHKLKDAPFGVAGYGEWGAIRVRNNPVAMGWLTPYIREPTRMR